MSGDFRKWTRRVVEVCFKVEGKNYLYERAIYMKRRRWRKGRDVAGVGWRRPPRSGSIYNLYDVCKRVRGGWVEGGRDAETRRDVAGCSSAETNALAEPWQKEAKMERRESGGGGAKENVDEKTFV